MNPIGAGSTHNNVYFYGYRSYWLEALMMQNVVGSSVQPLSITSFCNFSVLFLKKIILILTNNMGFQTNDLDKPNSVLDHHTNSISLKKLFFIIYIYF
jgi:hypothetical protein